MAVLSKPEESILNLLKESEPMSVNKIYQELSQKEGLSERIVKETILRLRQEGKIKPNRQWRMELVDNDI